MNERPGIEPRALIVTAFSIIVILGLILGLALNNGPLMILAFLALLLWCWWSKDARYARHVAHSEEFRFDRDKDRIGL